MSQSHRGPIPTLIKLHRQSRVLEIGFDDGSHFELACEYLRVYSPAADTAVARVQGDWPTGKEAVNIERITPVGNYAVQLSFDDGHDTGLYSWDTLYDLGKNEKRYWQRYLSHTCPSDDDDTVQKSVVLLYFAALADYFGREAEEIDLPDAVGNVSELLALLRARGAVWTEQLGEDQVTVTLNQQFASLKDRIRTGDEISITPKSST